MESVHFSNVIPDRMYYYVFLNAFEVNQCFDVIESEFMNMRNCWCFLFQIDTYEKIYSEVEEIEGVKIFENWFRVDAKPFKQALLNIVKRWSFMFKQHLIDHVTNR